MKKWGTSWLATRPFGPSSSPLSPGLAALDGYAVVLQGLLEGPHRSPRIGPDLFARRLALALHSPLSPSELLQRAQRRVEELDQELAAVAEAYLDGCDYGLEAEGQRQLRVGPASRGSEASRDRDEMIRAALRRVATEAPDDITIVATAEAALTRCTEAVRELRLVSVPEDPLRIELMPAFRRGVAVAYCDQAGPWRRAEKRRMRSRPRRSTGPLNRRHLFTASTTTPWSST